MPVATDLDSVTTEYLDVIRAVSVIAARPPHPSPDEEADRQRMIRGLQAREAALRTRRDILLAQSEQPAGAPLIPRQA